MSNRSRLLSRIRIPKQSGGGVLLRRDQRLRVVAQDGPQVGDLFAFLPDSLEEYMSAKYTMSKLRLFSPQVGKPLYSNRRRPLLLLEDDTVGVHDLLAPACDDVFYKEMGHDNHPSCRGNLVATLKEFAFNPVGLPDPVNLFQNTPVIDLKGNREVRESPAKPGDYVQLQALEDLLVIVTACSVDWPPLNGDKPKGLTLEVYA